VRIGKYIWCETCRQMVRRDKPHRFSVTFTTCATSDKPLDLSVFQPKGEWPTLDNAQEKHDTAD